MMTKGTHMKTKLASLTLIALVGVAGTTSAFAQGNYDDSASLFNQTSATQSQPAWQSKPLGYAVSGGATRAVNLDKEAKYLNVQQLETVQINVGGKTLIWQFDTLGTPVFQLSQIFPGVDGVTVYVSQNDNFL